MTGGFSRVTLVLCADCLTGNPGRCTNPGCALYGSFGPDLPLALSCETIIRLEDKAPA